MSHAWNWRSRRAMRTLIAASHMSSGSRVRITSSSSKRPLPKVASTCTLSFNQAQGLCVTPAAVCTSRIHAINPHAAHGLSGL